MAFFSKENTKKRGQSDEAKKAYLQYLGTRDYSHKKDKKRGNQGVQEAREEKRTSSEQRVLIQHMEMSEIPQFIGISPYIVQWNQSVVYVVGKCAGGKIVLHKDKTFRQNELLTIVPASLLENE